MQNRKEKRPAAARLKNLVSRYRHAWILSYFIPYLAWFSYLERTVTSKFHIITMQADLKIPFCEFFIIPYMMWFFYMAVVLFYFLFCSRQDYYKMCAFLFTGMTIFLIVSTVYPNGHYLRPLEFARDNWCTDLVRWLYETDTSTNLFPSIHVYNSLGVHIAICSSRRMKNKKICRFASGVLCVSIILSTVFLKQHSIFDMLTAFGLAAIMYYFVYSQAYKKALAVMWTEKRRKRHALKDLQLRM